MALLTTKLLHSSYFGLAKKSLGILYDFQLNLQPCLNDVRITTVRHKQIYIGGRIRGGGRPTPPGKIPPMPSKYGWRPILPEDGKYTIKPLPVQKLGGRDPETGRVVVKTIGGGRKLEFRWVIYDRSGPKEGPPLEEKVFLIREDYCRTSNIALVGSGDKMRWILAHATMKVGDIIRSSSYIPRIPVRARDGDSHPLGALPVGTCVHNIEKYPEMGGDYCRAAGSSAQIIRKIDDRVIIQLPSKEQLSLKQECIAVVGQVSNPNHGKQHIGSPQRLRWLGKRQRSGQWHRKDGYCGRKIHPPKPLKIIGSSPPAKNIEPYQLTL
ncbi:39S ribosomal protein L2, mitochondrial-like [Centruroides sculpturatus]|uniref:39S ribosomal protein L2, mitochondrial-like n=1 Tax=Centruroides sculpturatus TaxID=218467 RepID=UPI000C6DCA15|nr:39S ribosomal protein L2, mitochondrial-like [Centruroides sculpturatus]